VGPFAVPGAARQAGTVLVSSTLADLLLDFQPHTGPLAIDLQRRSPTDEERRADPALVAAFRYGNVAPAEGAPNSVGAGQAAGLGPWLDIGAEQLHSQVKARVTHHLTLRPDAGGASRVWQSKTLIDVTTPRWADVEHIKVQLPDGWEPGEDFGAVPTGTPRVAALKLPRTPGEPGAGKVTLTFSGRWPDKYKPEGSAALGLPRPLGTIDATEIKVDVGRDLEISSATPPGLDPVGQTPHEQTWQCRTPPEALAVSWRPYVPDVRVQSLADVDLTPRGGQVRQEIRLQPGPGAAAAGLWGGLPQVALRLPPGVPSVVIDEGGTAAGPPEARGPAGSVQAVNLGKTSGTEHRLVLRYDFTAAPAAARPGDPATFTVPLVVPEPMTQGEARVRLWCETGTLPVLLDGTPWAVRPIEDVVERKTLPVLVAWAPRADVPLPLRWGGPQAAFPVLAERALVRVRLLEDGSQRCTVRYRLRQLAAGEIDVDFPAPVAALNLQAALDHKRVAFDVVDEAGQPSDGGRVARLRLAPDLVRPTSVLDFSYLVGPGRVEGGTLTTVLQPPVLRGDAGAVPVCWQVRVPSSRVVLAPENGPGVTRTWGRHGWLLAPRLSGTPTDLDRDLLGEDRDAEAGEAEPSLICWRSGLGPLTLTHVPQKEWMLACSLGLVVVGLVLLGLGRPSRGPGWVLVLLALAVAAGAVLRPTALAALVYGCEPGAAVLLAIVVMQWLLHERYRRQVVFLPSFSRGRSGSSMLRGSSAARQPGEPSTVDAPRAAGSSAGK
jgi:hypothetical protein